MTNGNKRVFLLANNNAIDQHQLRSLHLSDADTVVLMNHLLPLPKLRHVLLESGREPKLCWLLRTGGPDGLWGIRIASESARYFDQIILVTNADTPPSQRHRLLAPFASHRGRSSVLLEEFTSDQEPSVRLEDNCALPTYTVCFNYPGAPKKYAQTGYIAYRYYRAEADNVVLVGFDRDRGWPDHDERFELHTYEREGVARV